MFGHVRQKLASGGIVLLDGGTGTEIERRGAPMSEESWCAPATLTHGHIVAGVHRDYIAAGAEVITANTYGSSPFVLDHHGKIDELEAIDARAVEIAREAAETADRPVAVAGSFSVMRPNIAGTDRTRTDIVWSEDRARALLRRKADALADAGVDLIMLEMLRDPDISVWATEAAASTGLPVWAGISAERDHAGRLTAYSRPEFLFEAIVAPIMAAGASVCSVMHTSVNDTGAAIDIVRRHWHGPVGAYPESGYFKMPSWQFVDIIAPDDLVAAAREWVARGARLLGGCCGTGPEHIRAIAEAFGGWRATT